ncbi:MAG TPA: hypothetical protein VMT00_09905 [Thermoanaerobaculia bacterium]|nr:hypothetical protein [Thermoanaerobaculia bacterium]
MTTPLCMVTGRWQLAEELDASVREKYLELWESAQHTDQIGE